MLTMGRKAKPKTARGRHLLAIRKKWRLTQKQAAEKVFVSLRTWAGWETGERTPTPGQERLIKLLDDNGSL